jgi:hypothetical protein
MPSISCVPKQVVLLQAVEQIGQGQTFSNTTELSIHESGEFLKTSDGAEAEYSAENTRFPHHEIRGSAISESRRGEIWP